MTPRFVLAPDDTIGRLRQFGALGIAPATCGIEQALQLLRTAERGVFAFDPRGLRESEFERVMRALGRAHVHILLYTTPAGVPRAIRIRAASPLELLIIGVDHEQVLLPTLRC